MAMHDNVRPAPFGAITIFRLSEGVSNVASWVRERRAERRTAAALCRLSPQMLEDIGLTEADRLRFGCPPRG